MNFSRRRSACGAVGFREAACVAEYDGRAAVSTDGADSLGVCYPESYRLIWRLLKQGPVEVEVNIKNAIGDRPVKVYNTIAELRGRKSRMKW